MWKISMYWRKQHVTIQASLTKVETHILSLSFTSCTWAPKFFWSADCQNNFKNPNKQTNKTPNTTALQQQIFLLPSGRMTLRRIYLLIHNHLSQAGSMPWFACYKTLSSFSNRRIHVLESSVIRSFFQVWLISHDCDIPSKKTVLK